MSTSMTDREALIRFLQLPASQRQEVAQSVRKAGKAGRVAGGAAGFTAGAVATSPLIRAIAKVKNPVTQTLLLSATVGAGHVAPTMAGARLGKRVAEKRHFMGKLKRLQAPALMQSGYPLQKAAQDSREDIVLRGRTMAHAFYDEIEKLAEAAVRRERLMPKESPVQGVLGADVEQEDDKNARAVPVLDPPPGYVFSPELGAFTPDPANPGWMTPEQAEEARKHKLYYDEGYQAAAQNQEEVAQMEQQGAQMSPQPGMPGTPGDIAGSGQGPAAMQPGADPAAGQAAAAGQPAQPGGQAAAPAPGTEAAAQAAGQPTPPPAPEAEQPASSPSPKNKKPSSRDITIKVSR